MPAILHIFNLNGGFAAYELDPQGVLRIGRDRRNDVVLDDPGIADFHLVLDCRANPCRLVVLSYRGRPSLDDTLLPTKVAVPLTGDSILRVANYELKLLPGPAQPPPAVRPEPAAGQTAGRANGAARPGPAVIDLPSSSVPAGSAGADGPDRAVARFSVRPAEKKSDYLLIEPAGFPDQSRTLPVEPGQEVSFGLNVTNNGRQFAQVVVTQEGLDPAWVKLPAGVNIRPQETATLSVVIAPPKRPNSRAGSYHFAVRVTSGHYRDQPAQFGATLVVSPYYEFAVGELSPRRRTISWFRRSAETRLTVINRGNSPATFQLEGQDDEKSCRYEFHNLPGEPVPLTGQAPLRLPPARRLHLPLKIWPHARPLLLRSRAHHFTISAIPLEGRQTPRRLAGELKQKPLFGFVPVLLMTLLLLFLCVSAVLLTFRPHIDTFTVNGRVGRVRIKANETVLLGWKASPFANLRIDPQVGPLDSTTGEQRVTPAESTVYQLRAENFLSRLLPFLSERVERVVEVSPVRPKILDFTASQSRIVTGQKITLAWLAEDAQELVLSSNGAPEVIPTAEYAGQRSLSPNEDTVYILEARNRYGTDSNHLRVAVVTPTGTPVPTPAVEFFTALPNRTVAGEPVTLNWSVSGADSVEINPLGPVPPTGPIAHSPQQTTLYTLLAVKPGAASVSRVQEVVVDQPTGTPTVTATPAPPVIEFFTASATTFVLGGADEENSVTLSWSVTGPTTDVQLFNPDLGLIKGLQPVENNFVILVNENRTTFVLTAANGDQSTSQNLQLVVQTATPEPTATPPPTATATPLPAPRIVFFKAENGLDTPADHVELLPGTNQYRVVAGANVKFSWSVHHAAQVTLLAGGQSLGAQPFEGHTTISAVKESKTYELRGANAQNNSISEFIQLQVEPNSAEPPFDFSEVGVSFGRPTYEFTWAYLDENDILGFRIYRASGGSFDYQRMVDLPPTARTWTDSALPTNCDRFYIVATYINLITGQIEETDAGSPSWNSSGC